MDSKKKSSSEKQKRIIYAAWKILRIRKDNLNKPAPILSYIQEVICVQRSDHEKQLGLRIFYTERGSASSHRKLKGEKCVRN